MLDDRLIILFQLSIPWFITNSLCNTIENLEGRCEELTKQIDELNQIIVIERRKKERLMQENKQLSESNGEKNTADRVQLRSVKNQGKSNADTVDGSGDAVSRLARRFTIKE